MDLLSSENSEYRWWGRNCPRENPGTSHCVSTVDHKCGDITHGSTAKDATRATEEERRRYTRLVANLGKKGRWSQALSAIEEMQRHGVLPDAETWNLAVLGCVRSGRWDAALRLREDVDLAGYKLEEETYDELISACFRAGEWQQCLELIYTLQRMDIAPKTEAYRCAVRACLRAKQYPVVLRTLEEMGELSLEHFGAAQQLRLELSKELPAQWQQWEKCRAHNGLRKAQAACVHSYEVLVQRLIRFFLSRSGAHLTRLSDCE